MLVVALVAFEAGEEDADPTVGDLAEGLAVGLVPFAASRHSGGADYIRAAAIGCSPANVLGVPGRKCQYRTVDEFELRAATPADADAVADYHHRCFMTTYASQLLAGEFEVPDLAGTREQLRDWFQPASEFETRVAVVDGAPIGHVTVRGHQLVHLFVEPDHQKMGLGRHLLGHGEAMIAAAGHTDFELHARVENLAAIAF